MNFIFGEKKTIKQQARDAKRDIGKSVREIGRDERKLKQEEKKLQKDIKECLKRGDKRSATTLAKALVKNRHMQQRIVGSKANMTSMKYEVGNMATQVGFMRRSGCGPRERELCYENVPLRDATRSTARFGNHLLILANPPYPFSLRSPFKNTFQAKMAEVMGSTAKVMKNMNEAAGVKKTAQVRLLCSSFVESWIHLVFSQQSLGASPFHGRTSCSHCHALTRSLRLVHTDTQGISEGADEDGYLIRNDGRHL